eukprot:1159649-Pelagomonas_calceolata.AAC.8
MSRIVFNSAATLVQSWTRFQPWTSKIASSQQTIQCANFSQATDCAHFISTEASFPAATLCQNGGGSLQGQAEGGPSFCDCTLPYGSFHQHAPPVPPHKSDIAA